MTFTLKLYLLICPKQHSTQNIGLACNFLADSIPAYVTTGNCSITCYMEHTGTPASFRKQQHLKQYEQK